MKRMLAIILLFSAVNAINAESWAERLQQALTGQPAVTTTATVAAPTAAADTQSTLAQVQQNIPSLIANIKAVVAKLSQITQASQEQGFFAGLKAAFSIDQATAQAFASLRTQLAMVVPATRSLLNSSDPATRETARSLVARVVQIPEFQQLIEYAKNMPFVGSQIEQYLNTLKQEAAGK